MATISLTNRLRDAADRLAGLLRIAEDGVIDDAERPEFDDIVQDLRETIAAAYQVIYADAKKERPEAGTSKRSVSQRKTPESHCKHSISQKQTNVNTFRGEARAWAACNIKCERTNTTSNDGYAFYRIYFFTIKSPKAQGGRENEARFF